MQSKNWMTTTAALVLTSSLPTAQVTELASRANDGAIGDNGSGSANLSANGRFVTFTSDAENLVPFDNNEEKDVFVRDRATGQIERINVNRNGQQASGAVDISLPELRRPLHRLLVFGHELGPPRHERRNRRLSSRSTDW